MPEGLADRAMPGFPYRVQGVIHMRRAGIPLVWLAVLLAFSLPAAAGPITVGFDDAFLADGDVLAAQYDGLVFTNAIVLTAGIGLNEVDFPPRSAFNVASDDGGPVAILFGAPVGIVEGYFTYAVPLTMRAFDAAGRLLGTVTSACSSSLAPDPGCGPNELLRIVSNGGIAMVSITGDEFGNSFTLDDLTYTSAGPQAPVPEPATLTLLALGGAGILVRCRRQR